MDLFKRFFAVIASFVMMLLSLFGVGENLPIPEPDTVPQTEITTQPTTQPQITTTTTEATTEPPVSQYENVIFMIGDGMGFNHLEAAKQYLGTELFMDTFALKGASMTRLANSSVTDSAAGGTALACGVKTNNGCIGVYSNDVNAVTSHPMSLTELAMSEGMKTGFITSDSPYGATPGTFSAHTSSRSNSADIVAQQIVSGIDLMWFATSGSTWSESDATSNGYSYVTNRESMLALQPGTDTVGEFTQSTMWKGEKSSVYDVNPSLSELTEKAIELLENEDGFFLMVEGAHIDKNAHNNDMQLTAWAVDEFDNAVEKAVDFARQDGHTLVIVTADHETGGITLDNGTYGFTTGSHTGANVPLLVYGDDDFIVNGEIIDNTQVSLRAARFFSDKEFPAAVSAE